MRERRRQPLWTEAGAALRRGPIGHPVDGGGRSWTLDRVDAAYGQGTLRMVTTAGSLRTMPLTNMVFLPSTRSFITFSFQWTPDDAGASVQYNLTRAD